MRLWYTLMRWVVVQMKLRETSLKLFQFWSLVRFTGCYFVICKMDLWIGIGFTRWSKIFWTIWEQVLCVKIFKEGMISYFWLLMPVRCIEILRRILSLLLFLLKKIQRYTICLLVLLNLTLLSLCSSEFVRDCWFEWEKARWRTTNRCGSAWSWY